MGTNYYKVYIPTEDEIDELQRDLTRLKEIRKGISDESAENVKDHMREILSRANKVHICKKSWGWKTNFDHNWGKYYKPTKESIDAFLRSPDGYMIDEYGEIIDIDDFWKDTFERDAKPDVYTSETYRKTHPEEHYYLCRDDQRKVKELFGITTYENDFESDGLRFAVFSDFS